MYCQAGLPDAAVKESRDRVSTALTNSGFKFPMGRPAINLAPADVRHSGQPIVWCYLNDIYLEKTT